MPNTAPPLDLDRLTAEQMIAQLEAVDPGLLAASSEVVTRLARCLLELEEIARHHQLALARMMGLAKRLRHLIWRIQTVRPDKWAPRRPGGAQDPAPATEPGHDGPPEA